MKRKIHGLLALLLTLSMLTGMFPATAFAVSANAAEATVYLTVSNQGLLAADNDGKAMANREVTVTDRNGDGKLSYEEALVAGHETYHSADGYSAPGGYVGKLWGIESANTLFFVNNQGLATGVSVDTVANGDRLVASINKDNMYYSDWYSFFDATEKTVTANEEFSLILKGHLGMAWTDADKADTALENISIGVWENGTFSAIEGKTTDSNGNVTLSFEEAGTYTVSAEGFAEDVVTDYNLMNMSTQDNPVYGVMDFSTYETQMAYTEADYGDGPYPADEVRYVDFMEWKENQESYHTLRSNQLIADCPIIAPVCVVTVAGDAPQMSDVDAVNSIYEEFSKSEYANLTKTPLIFPLEYNGTTYTNVLSYLKAWALYETGRDVTIDYTPYIYTTNYSDWSTGALKSLSYDGMDINGEITQDYFTNNANKNMNRLDKVTFTVGSASSEEISKLCVSVQSLQRTPEELVNYVAAQLPFHRIIGSNASANSVVSALGEKSGSSTALPNACGLYNTTAVDIKWTAESVSGKSDAFTINERTRVTTVTRPNVGEEDAVFDLTAAVASKADTAVRTSITHRITIPAFEAVTVPFHITEGASLSLTDSYYGNAAVENKYIVKTDGAPEGYDRYTCMLHTGAAGSAQKFTYTVSKEGYITKTGTISVTDGGLEPTVVDLPISSEDDTKLKSLSVTAPSEGSSDFVTGLVFDPDTYEYHMDVKGIRTLKFAGEAATEGADIKITSYYKSLADANSGTLTTSGKAITTLCYLPDEADTSSAIVITVTAPESSTQQEKTRTYTIHVNKSAASGPMTAFAITPSSTTGGKKDNWAGKDGEMPLEEELTPVFVNGSLVLGTYTVNYWRDQITVKPTAANCTILVGNETVASGKASSEIALNVGENKIPIQITDENDVVTEYTLTVYRKSQLDITAVEIENGALNTEFGENGSNRTGNGRFSNDSDTLRLKFDTNVAQDEEVDIRIALKDQSYTGKAGEFINVPVKDMDTAMLYVWLYRTVDGVKEGQVYIINMSRMPADSPSSVASYLPAPGQFVNQPIYANPNATLAGKQMITLGAFGGNVVYRYDTPIENNPMNPYGIDFIVEGNVFTNADGTSSQSASEPAAVMVSQDGEHWYELAGSEYYDANTVHNLTVTYTNPDPSFAGAVHVPWTDNQGGSGTILTNDHHTQPYYPNPAVYQSFQNGIGKNDTYTDKSVSFTGTKTAGAVYPAFGYADNHAAGDDSNSPAANPKGNTAANPYIENHYAVYNGDGFDLDWAVDGEGNPVKLDSISYIKIYNPWLYDGGATGEKSPEILQVLRAAPAEEAVGKTAGLAALSINGKSVALEDGTFTYEVDAEGANSLTVTPTAANAEANIYVSNQRVGSGASTKAFTAVEKLRIIVQEEKKEPAIYLLNLTNVKAGESNADLKSLTLTPGDDVKTPDENGKLAFSVSNLVKSIRFAPEMNYQQATAVLTGENIEDIALQNKTTSPAIAVSVGENHFILTVTSADQSETKSYSVTVNRAGSGSSSEQDTIDVKFSLTGDKLHYDKETGSNTGKHTDPVWIKSQSVNIPTGSTVKYITEMMLNNAGLDYISDGIYISEIDGLGEFDNGPKSGWMYRHNGKIANEGYATRVLSESDQIEWFYTDDYTKEKDYEEWDPDEEDGTGGGSGGGSGSSSGHRGSGTNVVSPEEPDKTDQTFRDVPESHWAAAYIKVLADKKLINGKSETEFAPEDNITRAEFAAILSRMSGDDLPAAESNFTDVANDAWYAANVTWAVTAGVVKGVSETEFAPDANITRQDMAVMIERYAAYKAYTFAAENEVERFADENEIAEYAKNAVSTMQQAGIISGMGDNTFAPLLFATRAQAAKMLGVLLVDMDK